MSAKRVRVDHEPPLELMELGFDFDPGISYNLDLQLEPENLVLSPPTPPDPVPVIAFDSSTHIFSQTSIRSESPEFIMSTPDPADVFSTAVQRSIEDLGTLRTTEILLNNPELRNNLRATILSDAKSEFKNSLTGSILTKSRKDKDHLFKLTPTYLCNEFKEKAPQMFHIVCNLLDNEENDIESDSNLRNIVAMICSLFARHLNRKASAYAQLLTSVARDGGLREDSIKLLSNLSHPRTLQKFDKGKLQNIKK